MAPKKRKDLDNNRDAVLDDNNAVIDNSSTVDDAHLGEAQAHGIRASSTLSGGLEAEHLERGHGHGNSEINTIRQEDITDDNDNFSATSQTRLQIEQQAPETMTTEEIELEIRILTLRQTLLKNKRVQERTPEPQILPRQASTPQASAPRASVPTETDSMLRERQDERLRRAGLLPPRAHEARQARHSAATPTIRHPSAPASPPTLLLNGIDRKVADIMNSTDKPGSNNVGEKSELSRLGIKVAGPDKWKGERSLQTFMDWTQSVAHYFSLYSPMSERLKIQLIGGYLLGDPLDWYWRHVAPTAQQWSAADVMVALRRQFLVDELSRQAADKFETMEQGSKDIHAFQADLLRLADQMTEYPSPIALNRRLLNGMKHSLSAAIIANRGIDAEVSAWEDIVQAAMDQERANRQAGIRSKIVTTRDNDNERSDQETQKSSIKTDSPAAPYITTQTKPTAPQPTTGTYRRPFYGNRSTDPPSRPTASGTLRPTGPKPTDQCRSCGGLGHWASDCPARLRTNLVSIDDDTQDPYDKEWDDYPTRLPTTNDDDNEPRVLFLDDE
ncbi:hypothetical protein A4X13_0g9086 [Tilletia indica]|uniref:CCHC-type domain-containing protein n=1 Tax=Tilletia indica TaxID=43049 RepID=A0A8T8SBG2_9BASI|nr:hypothetical protein A4X13_0g9086 [Tilletia indica]